MPPLSLTVKSFTANVKPGSLIAPVMPVQLHSTIHVNQRQGASL